MQIRHSSGAALTLMVFCALMLGVASYTWAADPSNESRVHHVIIPEEDRFTPYGLTIHTGESIQWVNEDTDDHTVVSDDKFTTAGHKGTDHTLPGTENNQGRPSTFTLQFSKPG